MVVLKVPLWDGSWVALTGSLSVDSMADLMAGSKAGHLVVLLVVQKADLTADQLVASMAVQMVDQWAVQKVDYWAVQKADLWARALVDHLAVSRAEQTVAH